MREHAVVCAGSGGQGIQLMGQTLSYAAMLENKGVTWFPEYGPEVRGGRTACTVVVAPDQVGSPVVAHPHALIALDAVSIGEFADSLRPGGLLVLNSSLIDDPGPRDDLEVLALPAQSIAEEIGNARAANMVMLGAYVQRTGVVSVEVLPQALRRSLPERHHRFIPINLSAIQAGAESA
ncbi:MAG: 2-oxoacid:acceptor oxidoreductase family protein [Armatimonadota bacterium]